jgi:hypothetical protein
VLVPELTTAPRRNHRLGGGTRVALAAVAVGAAVGPSAADAATISKTWADRWGEFTSRNWTTTRRATQTLTFTSCSHDWSWQWGREAHVQIELVEVKDRMPDVRRAEWKYACNNNDQAMTSPVTNSTKFHFVFDPDVNATTDGAMRIRHS